MAQSASLPRVTPLPARWVSASKVVRRRTALRVAADGAAASGGEAPASTVKPIRVPIPKIDVDIKKLVTYNFLVQAALTASSWATVFITSHAQLAQKSGLHPTVGILLVGVALSGYSAYQSYKYFSKVKSGGLGVLEGWAQLKEFYDHMVLNFVGVIAALLALQAEVGSLMLSGLTSGAAAAKAKSSSLAVEALAQASANTILAHVVSLLFLTLLVRKITDAAQKLIDWSEQLKKALPAF